MLLDAMRLKVPELSRHFDDNLRPKASNLRPIQYDSELNRPKASNSIRFGTEAPKNVECATKSVYTLGLTLLLYYLL